MAKTRDLKFKNHHRWGFKDSFFIIENNQVIFKSPRNSYSFFANQPLPQFLNYVTENIGLDLTKETIKSEKSLPQLPKPQIPDQFLQELQSILNHNQISIDTLDRVVHSHGQTTSEEIYKILYEGTLNRFIDLVLFAQDETQVNQIIQICLKHNICLVPYGGGTSVSGALILPKNENRLMVSLDMRRMNTIEKVNEKNLTARIQAGITGKELEESLNSLGYTMGHEPDSMEFSTLGGWISTNASGMKKNRYGNIEDIVLQFNLVSPIGELYQIGNFDRSSIGMQPTKLLFGSEGNLGVITTATVKIHKLVEKQKYASIIFKDMDTGTNFLRDISKSSIKPSSIRLVDNAQFTFGAALRVAPKNWKEKLITKLQKFVLLKVKKLDPKKISLLTLVMEGSSQEVKQLEKSIDLLRKKHQGITGGEKNGKRAYLLTNIIAYIRDFLGDYQCIGETLETTVTWDKIKNVSKTAHQTLIDQHQKYNLPGKPYFSYRITQLYHSSVCIYIMLGLCTKGIENATEIYTKIESAIRDSIMKAGGSLSHHHGIGKLRQPFSKRTLSQSNIELLKSVKDKVDPHNIFGIQNNLFTKNS